MIYLFFVNICKISCLPLEGKVAEGRMRWKSIENYLLYLLVK